MIFSRVENLIIPTLSSVYILGLYSITKIFYNIIITIPTAFSGYVFGIYCDNDINFNIQLCLRVMVLILILSSAATIIIFYFINYFLIVAFGSDFTIATDPAKILIASALVLAISMPINSLLFAINKPIIPSTIGILSIINTIAMMFLLIPKYSLIGAAYASFIGSILITFLRCYCLVKVFVAGKIKDQSAGAAISENTSS